MNELNGRYVFGGIIRDSKANWLGGYYGKLDVCTSLKAEFHAMFVGLEVLKSKQLKEVIVETDFQVAYNLIRSQEDKGHQLTALIEDVKALIQELNLSVHHSLREGNQCADFLAKLGASQELPFVYLVEPIPYLTPFLKSDEAGVSFIGV